MSEKYALYSRVSTDQQHTENQKRLLVEYADRHGYDFDLYEEQMTTRKTRPVKQDVLYKLRQKVYKGVIIWRLDRWARSSRELLLEIQELHDKGIVFISINDNIDLNSPTGKLQFQILSAFAEFERNLISERTKEGLARAKAEGKKLGRPWGAKDKGNRRKSGYILKEALKRKRKDEIENVYKPVEHYIDTKEHSPLSSEEIERIKSNITPPNNKDENNPVQTPL